MEIEKDKDMFQPPRRDKPRTQESGADEERDWWGAGLMRSETDEESNSSLDTSNIKCEEGNMASRKNYRKTRKYLIKE